MIQIVEQKNTATLNCDTASLSFKAKTLMENKTVNPVTNLRADILYWTGIAEGTRKQTVISNSSWAGDGANLTLGTNWLYLNNPSHLTLTTS